MFQHGPKEAMPSISRTQLPAADGVCPAGESPAGRAPPDHTRPSNPLRDLNLPSPHPSLLHFTHGRPIFVPNAVYVHTRKGKKDPSTATTCELFGTRPRCRLQERDQRCCVSFYYWFFLATMHGGWSSVLN